MRKFKQKGIGCILTEVFSDDTGILIENSVGARYWWTNQQAKEGLVEYKEPRKIERFTRVWDVPKQGIQFGESFSTEKEAWIPKNQKFNSGWKLIGVCKQEFTEEV